MGRVSASPTSTFASSRLTNPVIPVPVLRACEARAVAAAHPSSPAQPGCAGRGPRLGHGSVLGFLGLGLLAGVLLHGPQARAQALSPNQPAAIRVQGIPPVPCPLLVPANDAALQPLRIAPSQVAMKNSMGCLSPSDASLYGPNGCPVKLCKLPQGTVPLPQR